MCRVGEDPNGLTQTSTYDKDGNSTAITDATTSDTLESYTYGCNPASQLTSQSFVGDGTSSSTYTYDPLGQLNSQTDTNSGTLSSFTATSGGELASFYGTQSYNAAQELTETDYDGGSDYTYGYDANGRRTSESSDLWSATMTYDPAGNLQTATTTSGTVAYTSDGDGLRQTRTTDGTTQNFTWDTQAATALLLDDGTDTYLYGPGTTPIAQVDDTAGTIQYLSTDNIGSVTLITDAAGHDDGEPLDDAPYGMYYFPVTSIGYAGNWIDPITDFIYLRARDYDPYTGQFLTRDPLESITGQPYEYAGDNPLENIDPSGFCTSEWGCRVLGAAEGLVSGSWRTTAASDAAKVAKNARVPDYYSLCASGSTYVVVPSGCTR